MPKVSNTSKLYLDWLQAGLRKPGKSGKGLAGVLGVSESAVSRLLAGKRRFQLLELPKIAGYLEEEVPASEGASGRAQAAREQIPEQPELGNAQAVPLVRVTAIIAPAVWREAGAAVAVAERIPASPDPRLARMKQYACRIEAEPNRFAICVRYEDMRASPMAGDVVHVRRTRKGFFEDTIRIVRIGSNGNVALELAGAATKSGEARVYYPAGAKALEDIEIKGLVVGYFHAATF
jgi:transcriptional regulator with XRE-family HTH domain